MADGTTIYLISDGLKIPFTNWNAFVGLGYSLSHVMRGDTSGYPQAPVYTISTARAEHPWGSWLLKGKTVYYTTANGPIPVPSWNVFLANGGQAQYILPMNSYDLSILWRHPSLPPLQSHDPRAIY